MVALCKMRDEAADSHNCSVFKVKRRLSPRFEENVWMRDDIQATAGGAFNQNSRAPVAKEGELKSE